MWWQGEENAPEIVKMCLSSLRRNAASNRIILIDKNNYQEYLSLPPHILSKVASGCITLTHFSDIIRAGLLSKYGGLWIDATIFAASRIPEEIFTAEYFTIKMVEDNFPKILNPSLSRWTVFFFGAGRPGAKLFCFMYDILSEYWKTHEGLIEYFIIDYVIALAFDEFPDFREAWRHIPVNNTSWYKLVQCLNQEWDDAKFSEMCMTNQFFKLTYKKDFYRETASGLQTFYGRLLSEYGINS